MSFTENNHNGLIYMSSDKIGARHAFTTRYGGVSTGIFSSLNLGSNRGDDPEAVRENYRRVCGLMGVGIDDMAVTQQVHKADVRIVTSADKHVCMSHVPYEADGIVTSERGLPIMCETDDDVPQAIERYLSGDTDGLFDRRPGGKTMVDLRAANARRLIQLGVLPENIDISDECTYCRHDKYWSHRYTHGQRGSQAALIVLD